MISQGRERERRILLSGNKGILNIDKNQEPSLDDNIAKFFLAVFKSRFELR
jgi:hypothetical protein